MTYRELLTALMLLSQEQLDQQAFFLEWSEEECCVMPITSINPVNGFVEAWPMTAEDCEITSSSLAIMGN